MVLPGRYLLFGLLGLVAAPVAVGYVLASLGIVPFPRGLDTCQERVAMTPVELPGRLLDQHRRWLLAPVEFERGAQYFIVNDKRFWAYRFRYMGTHDGNARFAVQTRWVIFNLDWAERDWTLLYDCPD